MNSLTEQTPFKRRPINNLNTSDLLTPPLQKSLSDELRKVINERNLLTVKSREKVCKMLNTSDSCNMDKRQSFRNQAVEEILTSEKSYLNQLNILIEYFINPLKDIIDTSTHTLLFGHIEMIYNLNSELLKELESNLNNVAQAFLKLAPFLKLYSVYAFDYKQALLTLQELYQKNYDFKLFISNTESRPEVQTKLNSLLIVPIQRIPRYRLLLQQVLLYTAPSNEDYKLLNDSIKKIENTIKHIDSVIEDQETTQVLINLQNSLTNRLPNIVRPSRKIIKEGVLMRISSNGMPLKRYCILMSDIFMYCKVLKDRPHHSLLESSLKCSCIFPLKKCKVNELFPGNFKISCYGDGVIFQTDDNNVQKSWVSTLKETIELHIKCRKTLRKESSNRKPLRKARDVQQFEHELTLSPNTRRGYDENIFRDSSSSNEDDNEGINCLKNSKLKRKHSSILKKPQHDATVFIKPINESKQSKFLDILYPLRETNSNSSINSEAKSTKSNDDIVIPQKRVRFELDTTKYEINDYSFPNDFQRTEIKNPGPTIGQRISKFFTQLF